MRAQKELDGQHARKQRDEMQGGNTRSRSQDNEKRNMPV